MPLQTDHPRYGACIFKSTHKLYRFDITVRKDESREGWLKRPEFGGAEWAQFQRKE